MADDTQPQIPPQKIRIFDGLAPEEVEDLLGRTETVSFSKGTTIFREGAPGSYIFIVVDGVAAIYVNDKHIANCKEGEAFGEMSVLSGRPRSATATALSDVELLSLDEDEIQKLLQGPIAVRFLLNIVRELSKRLETGNTWVAASIEEKRGKTQ